MHKIYKVAVVGGGAAGLTCALELMNGADSLKQGEVVILERNDRVGKKLAATGNGQGNLTNANVRAENYYGDEEFVSLFIEDFNTVNLEKFLYSVGVPLSTAADGKKYPVSKQANAVLDVFRGFIDFKGVETKVNFEVKNITYNGNVYVLRSSDTTVFAEKVVVAVGGCAARHFGTDGSAYTLLENFGHKKTALYPSLVQLKTELAPIKGLKGLKEQATVTAFDGEKILKSCKGEVLFTEYGVSGSAVFGVSSSITNAKNPYLIIEFLPEYTETQTEKLIADKRKNTPFMSSNDLLSGILNKIIGRAILKTVNSDNEKAVAYALKNFRLKVTGNLGFNHAQVTKGGITTDKIRKHTFESKLSKGLYVVGEVLNVDGDCGGYNLTFAFVSGIQAARDIKRHRC